MPAENKRSQTIPGSKNPSARFAEIEYAKNTGRTLKRIITYFFHEKTMVILMFITVLTGTVCAVLAPVFQSDAVDIIAGSRSGLLIRTILLMSLFYISYSLSQLFQGFISANLSQRIVKIMRAELFEKIVDLPVKYLDTHSHGDVMSRMTNDIENISTTISQSLPSLCSGTLTIIGTAAIMFIYCWQLAILSIATIILTVTATKILSALVRKYSRRKQLLLGQLNGTAEEMISGCRTVTAYNQQKTITDKFCTTADKLTGAGIKTDITSGVMGPIMNCIGNIGFVIIAAFGGYFAIRGMISVGIISAFIVYARQFSRPINEVAQIYGQIQTAIAGAERVFYVMDEESEDMSGEEIQFSEGNAEIKFSHVNFSYTPDEATIRDFSLTVPSGKKVALVGATGSGKTTIVNLFMRFYDIDSGTITINNQNIQDISRNSIRKNAAIVLQDAVIFTDTVINNLCYANADASDEQIKEAVKLSRSEEMLSHMSDGYDTILTGDGANISQGQRQLLSIARAFIADPKILILDEATSNIDTRTEKAIQDAMHLIMQNRTSIVIAHRLSTIRDADIIVVMDKGSIVESGNYEQLMEKKGKYYELYMTQFAGFSS